MYNEKELLEKVDKFNFPEKFPTDRTNSLLRALIKDVEEMSEKWCQRPFEIYIGFDDKGNDSEYDTYGTFSIHLHQKNSEKTIKISDNMSITDIDNSLCTLYGYLEETSFEDGEIAKPMYESFVKDNTSLSEKIEENRAQGKLVYKDIEGFKVAKIEDFVKQPLEGQLYDLNRGSEIVHTFRNSDWSRFTQRWVNDLALLDILRYYFNRCNELEAKLARSEEENLVNKIMK